LRFADKDWSEKMFGNIGMSELLVIFILVLLLFGPKKLPELARGLGKGIQEFKKAADDVKRELTAEDDELKRTLHKKDE
jgi:TatA/E family protein of Tat protein translocase